MNISLAMCGVYRRFAEDISKIAKPLTDMKTTKFPMRIASPMEKETNDFEQLRGRLLPAPILALSERDGHYMVYVNACYEQLGRCLQQQQPEGNIAPSATTAVLFSLRRRTTSPPRWRRSASSVR